MKFRLVAEIPTSPASSKPAPSPISDPYGVPMEKAGTVRDGGSFVQRVTNISCWNTLMDEAAYRRFVAERP